MAPTLVANATPNETGNSGSRETHVALSLLATFFHTVRERKRINRQCLVFVDVVPENFEGLGGHVTELTIHFADDFTSVAVLREGIAMPTKVASADLTHTVHSVRARLEILLLATPTK